MDKCEWVEEKISFYTTKCGNEFMFEEGGPIQSEFVYCPFCGKEIEVFE